MWVVILYVCVAMAMALLGNGLVIVVFTCRWQSTNTTKVYVLVLAVLDLVCAVVSTPRELVPLTGNFSARDLGVGDYCTASIFLAYVCDFSSALILIVVALSRWLKVKDDGGHQGSSRRVVGEGREVPFISRAWGWWARGVGGLSRGIRTVRGAKIASVLSLVAALCLSFPTLVLYAPPPKSGTRINNCSGKVCGHCWQFADTDHLDGLDDLLLFYFLCFLLMALTMAAVYSATVRRLWAEEQQLISERVSETGTAVWRNSELPARQSVSLATLSGSQVVEHPPPPLPPCQGLQGSQRTKSETDAFSLTVHAGRLREDLGHRMLRSASEGAAGVFRVERGACLGGASLGGQTPSSRRKEPVPPHGDSSAAEGLAPNTPRDNVASSHFPPTSYTAQQISVIGLTMSRRNVITEAGNDDNRPSQPRPSVTSFQFGKLGNRTRMTTLVFLCVTLIFILSYLPFFIVRLSGPGPGHGSAWLEVLARSYLVSNCANPLVYAFFNPSFRNGLWKILLCRTEVI